MPNLRRISHGSSPHTRGARGHDVLLPARLRIIPAYAGSTHAPRRRRSLIQDHPRIRGEHGRRAVHSLGEFGSSPHTRGAQAGQKWQKGCLRIIPAYAGSTQARLQERPDRRDHPRIRGEHILVTSLQCFLHGSSPHTRGALNEVWVGDRGGGIIPAYAGSTLRNAYKLTKLEDHPRIRGEHARRCSSIRFAVGSSPHTRGALYSTIDRWDDRGIIPAYAGSTGEAVDEPIWA